MVVGFYVVKKFQKMHYASMYIEKNKEDFNVEEFKKFLIEISNVGDVK
jgi:hypothetical protein